MWFNCGKKLCDAPHFGQKRSCRAGARTPVRPCVRSLTLSTLSNCSRTARCAGTRCRSVAPKQYRSFGPEVSIRYTRGRGWQLQPFNEVKRCVQIENYLGPKHLLTAKQSASGVLTKNRFQDVFCIVGRPVRVASHPRDLLTFGIENNRDGKTKNTHLSGKP